MCVHLFPFLSPGIEPTGNRVMRPAVFTVDTYSAGQGQVTVYVEDPEGRREEIKPVLNESKRTYSVTYTPQVMGPHKVRITRLSAFNPRTLYIINYKTT